MGKVIKKSVNLRSLEDVEKQNIKVLKNRCRSFLNPKPKETHTEWNKIKDNLYRSFFNIVVPEDGEDYGILSSLEKIAEGRKVKYQLRFPDIKQVFDDQSYRPLRQLGKLVFNSEK